MGYRRVASPSVPSPAGEIESELASARASFHALLDSLSDEGWARRSRNPGWTNGEIVFHIAFAFMLLRSLVPMVRIWG
ncbi:MAG TPA: DinB family protein, partial [Anaerolineales bacterium]